MARGGITNIIEDGALGVQAPGGEGNFCALGVATGGAAPKGEILLLSDPAKAKKALGHGPLADLVVSALSVARVNCYTLILPGGEGGEAANADILSGIETLLDIPQSFEWIALAGDTDASLWAALAAKAEGATQEGRYIHIKAQARGPQEGETPDQWVASLCGAERGNVSSSRLQVYAGMAVATDPLKGTSEPRPLIGLACGMSARRKPHEPVDATRYGSIPGAVSLYPAGLTGAHIDALDDTGYTTACGYPGQKGLYITHGRMMASPTSDFGFEERRRIMDQACRKVQKAQFPYINSAIEVGADGSLEGLEMFQAISEQPLRIMASEGTISQGRVLIDKDQDVLATGKVQARIQIIPLGKKSWIENIISYHNPNLDKEMSK